MWQYDNKYTHKLDNAHYSICISIYIITKAFKSYKRLRTTKYYMLGYKTNK